jgi:DNA-binding transcriptional ArsR family regulator
MSRIHARPATCVPFSDQRAIIRRPMPPRIPLSDAMIELTAGRFRVLGEPSRLRILQVLERGPATVNQVVEQLGATQSNVSRHLQALYAAGLVARRRDGNSIFYTIADPMVLRLCALVCESATEQAKAKLKTLTATARARR